MRIALFPGNFNPLHSGHINVVEKAVQIFDKVIIAQRISDDQKKVFKLSYKLFDKSIQSSIECVTYTCSMKQLVNNIKPVALIKGLRNENDFRIEREKQYWNEDVGVDIPVVCFIADRQYMHYNSGVFRSLYAKKNKKKEKKNAITV